MSKNLALSVSAFVTLSLIAIKRVGDCRDLKLCGSSSDFNEIHRFLSSCLCILYLKSSRPERNVSSDDFGDERFFFSSLLSTQDKDINEYTAR